MAHDRVIVGDCRTVLPTLDTESVQCVVTSPPYWGQRDYGHDGQIGLERTPHEYVDAIVSVFHEVHRVLRADGTCWLNLGDSYIGARGGAQGATGEIAQRSAAKAGCRVRRYDRTAPGLAYKDLAGIPWRVAFALQDVGWLLRSDIIWAKPNPMPESVRDRPTKAHEYVFLLAKSSSYFYDNDAIREASGTRRAGNGFIGRQGGARDAVSTGGAGSAAAWTPDAKGRNARSVWTIPTQPYRGSHFATMPPKLAERCILAGSRPGDLVLDPFIGSGTVGEAAERLGRRWLGIDLGYAELSAKRTAQRGIRYQKAPATAEGEST